ncbi:hypothetical protein V1525DRAFT_428240 [Lipomyces kononenkoae]|uniref:Uncharacterized protein n=1 Tax=Lipomyces kononenkoae TaxID=34357 RepID=A0ACC3ST62_LIPKO
MADTECLGSLFSLVGKTALCTGATRGNGQNMSPALAEAGADIILVQRNENPIAKKRIEAVGRKCYIISADRSLPRKMFAPLSRSRRARPQDEWEEVLQVNFTTCFTLCRNVGKRIIDDGRQGKIINIASLLTFQVNVNPIAPGYIATDMNEALIADPVRSRRIMERIPAQRWGNPSDFEGAAIFLASNANKYVSGEILVVDGGWMSR